MNAVKILVVGLLLGTISACGQDKNQESADQVKREIGQAAESARAKLSDAEEASKEAIEQAEKDLDALDTELSEETGQTLPDKMERTQENAKDMAVDAMKQAEHATGKALDEANKAIKEAQENMKRNSAASQPQ